MAGSNQAATIAVNLVVNAKNFNKSLADAGDQSTAFAKKWDKIGKGIQSAGKTMAVTGAAITSGITAPTIALVNLGGEVAGIQSAFNSLATSWGQDSDQLYLLTRG